MATVIHPSAIVDDGALIGDDVTIWHFCHVMRGARIGPGTSLGQNCFVAQSATIGAGCKIQNNVSIYDGVILESNVFVGPSAVFTNVINPRADVNRKDQLRITTVRTGATIGANATIVCGIEIGAHAFVAAGAVVTRPVRPHEMVAGLPAKVIGYVCTCGKVRRAAKAAIRPPCPQCGWTT